MPPRNTLAILIERHGPPQVLVERAVTLRELGPDEVHLQVQAAGVNFADLLMRAGLYATVPPRPYSPGFEVAGQVLRVGADVEGWREGDRAVSLLRCGGYAHQVVVPARQLFPYPNTLTAAQAAAVPVVFLTAWVCLFAVGHAQRSECSLILTAAGGVGTAAVQLAVAHGLTVIGTAGDERKQSFVTEQLGADACFDSRDDWEDQVRDLVGDAGIDLALDAVGGRATASCRRLLAPLGRLVFYGLSDALPHRRRNWLRAAWAWLRTPRLHPYSLIQPNQGILGVHLLHLGKKESILGPVLEEIYQRVASGQLRPVVDRTLPFDRAGAVAAHEHIHARRNLGKVVLAREI